MSNYSKTTNFASKDALVSGNPNKVVNGTEIDTEFNNISTAVETKSETNNPQFTGTVTTQSLVTVIDDVNNETVTKPITLEHTTSGTPGTGIGVGIDFKVETSDGNSEIGASIDAVATNVGAAVEDFALTFNVMTAGATASEVARIDSAGLLTATTLKATTLNLSDSSAISSVKDEDTMVSDSATALATQQSIKAYVDASLVGSLTADTILDEDTMVSDSNVKVPTQQSTKAYVDAQLIATNSFPGALQAGNTTSGNDVIITAGDKITTDTIEETTLYAGVTIDSVLLKDNKMTAGSVKITTGAGLNKILTSDAYGDSTWEDPAPSIVRYEQNIKSTDYTLVLDDAGKSIFHPASDSSARTFTIPANASVAYDIGTVLIFVNEALAGSLTVAITSDTLQDIKGVTGTAVLTGGNVLNALKVTSTKWVFWTEEKTFEFREQIAIAHLSSPFLSVYDWSSEGFGGKYANPTEGISATGSGVAFSPTGTDIAVSRTGGVPGVYVYPWSAAGFGTRYSNVGGLPGNCNDLAFSPAGTEIAIARNDTGADCIMVIGWSAAGFGTKFSDPSTKPVGTGYAVEFSPAGTEIAITHNSQPYVHAYPWSASGFGSKFSNPATLPVGSGLGLAFNPTGASIAISTDSSPYLAVYPWSASGFGTKFSNPPSGINGGANSVAFSPAGTEIVIGQGSNPFVSAYPWNASTGFGAKLANPSTIPTGTGRGLAFNATGTEIAIAHAGSPYISTYPWTTNGFGTKFNNPATLPPSHANAAAFNVT